MTSDAAREIAEALADAGGDTVFGLPGGGNNLELIGAAEEAGLRFVLTHAETPAAIMAGVYAGLTDRPTGCVVTRGPGAASAVNGVANAMLDRQPVVLITDAVSVDDRQRIAHQRLDQRALLAEVSKASGSLGRGDAGSTSRDAVTTALTHPQGPVHLDFDPAATSTRLELRATSGHTEDTAARDRLVELLSAARRPVLLLGVGARHAAGAVRRLAESAGAPVLTTYRAKGLIPDTHPTNAGLLTGATSEAPVLRVADLVVTVGLDSVELIPAAWPYPAPVVSVAEWRETSPYFDLQAEVVDDLEKLVAELEQHWPETDWPKDFAASHRRGELDRMLAIPGSGDGVEPQTVVRRVQAATHAGTLVTVDAGAHMLPAMSLWEADGPDQVLISSGLATMGFAVPAAVGAALARPGQRVVAFTGDGGLGMCLGELETIVRHRLPVTVVVFNDSRLSLIAIKAKPEGNGGENAIGYGAIDFATVAHGYGLPGLRADDVASLDAALAEVLAQQGPALVDVRVDPSGYAAILATVRGQRPEETTPET